MQRHECPHCWAPTGAHAVQGPQPPCGCVQTQTWCSNPPAQRQQRLLAGFCVLLLLTSDHPLRSGLPQGCPLFLQPAWQMYSDILANVTVSAPAWALKRDVGGGAHAGKHLLGHWRMDVHVTKCCSASFHTSAFLCRRCSRGSLAELLEVPALTNNRRSAPLLCSANFMSSQPCSLAMQVLRALWRRC